MYTFTCLMWICSVWDTEQARRSTCFIWVQKHAAGLIQTYRLLLLWQRLIGLHRTWRTVIENYTAERFLTGERRGEQLVRQNAGKCSSDPNQQADQARSYQTSQPVFSCSLLLLSVMHVCVCAWISARFAFCMTLCVYAERGLCVLQ